MCTEKPRALTPDALQETVTMFTEEGDKESKAQATLEGSLTLLIKVQI